MPVIRDILTHDVHRHLDHDRPWPAVPKLEECASKNLWERAPHSNRLCPLGDVLHVEGRVEVRIIVRQASGIARRHHQDGHRFRVSLSNATEGVLSTRPMLHAKYANLISRRHAGVCISHMQANTLLSNNDGSDIDLGSGFNQGVNRVGKQDINPFCFHRVGDGVNYFHTHSPVRSNFLYYRLSLGRDLNVTK